MVFYFLFASPARTDDLIEFETQFYIQVSLRNASGFAGERRRRIPRVMPQPIKLLLNTFRG